MIICGNCIEFDSISSFINNNGSHSTCEYCGSEYIGIDDTLVFEFIESKLDKILIPINDLLDLSSYFYHADEDLHTFDSSSEYINNVFWSYQESNNQIYLKSDGNFLDKLIDYLPDDSEHGPFCFISDANRYNEIEDHDLVWDSLVNRLNHEFRYINNSLIDAYDRWLSPLKKEGKIKDNYVVTLSGDDRLYRARTYSSANERQSIIDTPYRQIGPAPCSLTSDQRMTSSGVSAFYSALDRETCLAEIRCESGTTAISGYFKPIKPLKLLNLSILTELHLQIDPIQDPFVNDLDDMIIATEFANTLYEHLIRPAKNEHKDTYRITQSFFEYLRSKFINQIHGVCFPSIQTDKKGKNIVVFPEYSVVCNNEGMVYSPYEERLFRLPRSDFGSRLFFNTFSKEPFLTFCDDSLEDHRIRSVSFSKDSEKIS